MAWVNRGSYGRGRPKTDLFRECERDALSREKKSNSSSGLKDYLFRFERFLVFVAGEIYDLIEAGHDSYKYSKGIDDTPPHLLTSEQYQDYLSKRYGWRRRSGWSIIADAFRDR